MTRMALWTLVAVAAIAVRPRVCLGGAQEPAPVEEWQIRGVRAALDDEYTEVRRSAIVRLVVLIGTEPVGVEQKRIWAGNLARLADQCKGRVRDLLEDENNT